MAGSRSPHRVRGLYAVGDVERRARCSFLRTASGRDTAALTTNVSTSDEDLEGRTRPIPAVDCRPLADENAGLRGRDLCPAHRTPLPRQLMVIQC